MKLLLASLGSAAVLAVGVSAQSVLFSDDFEADSSASWIVLEMSENGIPDYTAEFSFDYSQQDVTVNGVTAKIPAAPNSAAGTGSRASGSAASVLELAGAWGAASGLTASEWDGLACC